jgi:glycosyltransferase involved in cell wall biosynthesis
LRTVLAGTRPDVVQGWMYHGNLAALAAPSRTPVVWNIRQSIGQLRREKAATAAVILAGAMLSRRPRAIVYNSAVSAREHESLGYRDDRTRLIPNGFDLERFRPESAARARLRASLGIPADALVVGLLGRFHPMKDHANFLAALGRVLPGTPSLHAVLAGRGLVPGNAALMGLLPPGAERARVHLLGEVADVPGLAAGLDVLCLSSGDGEGFPNVVGEAMACEVPCVVTDSGDAAAVVGDTGLVVPRADTAALAAALADMLGRSPEARAELGRAARRRVSERFSIASIAAQYEALYGEVRGGGCD